MPYFDPGPCKECGRHFTRTYANCQAHTRPDTPGYTALRRRPEDPEWYNDMKDKILTLAAHLKGRNDD